jgi:hypothetical protein
MQRGISFGIHDDLARETKVDRLDAPSAGAPLCDVVEQQPELGSEIRIAEMHLYRRLILEARQAGKRGAQVLRVSEIYFADLIAGAGIRQIDLLHELDERSHALLTVGARHRVIKPCHDRKMEVAFERAVQNHAAFVNQLELIFGAQKRNRGTFG